MENIQYTTKEDIENYILKTSPTYMGTAVGGGSVTGKVFYNGTNWIT